MAYSARRISVSGLENYITQINHGFTVGQVVSFNGAAYVLAQANNLKNSQGIVMVSNIPLINGVPDLNHFVVTQDGYVTNLPLGKPPGVQWYLDPVNPGQLTSVEPSGVGNVILPCFVSTSSFEGYFQSNAGQMVESGPIFNWTIVTVNSNLSVNQGYMSSSGGTITLLLPAVSNLGDSIRITNLGGNFQITQGVGQSINFGDDKTTVGVGGSISSLNIGDSLELVCYFANTGFQVLSSMGNLTIV